MQPLSEYDCDIRLRLPNEAERVLIRTELEQFKSSHTVIDLQKLLKNFSQMKFSNLLMWQERGIRPLLLVYIFDKDSQPSPTYPNRGSFFSDSEEKVHVVIPVLVLPSAIMTDEEREQESKVLFQS